MHFFKRFLSLALIFSLGLTFTFASNGNHYKFETGNLTGKSGEAKEAIALKFIDKELANGEFRIIGKMTDDTGLSTIRVQQYYNGYPIFGADQIVNVAEDGIVKSFVGEVVTLDNKLTKKATHKKAEKEAIKIALGDLGLDPVLNNDPTADIVVYNSGNSACYAYQVELVFDDPTPGRWFYFINTENGEIVNKYNTLSGARQNAKPSGTLTFLAANTVTGTGTDVLGVNRSITTNKHTDGKYYLADMTRGKGILTYNANNLTTLPGTMWSDLDNVYNLAADKAAVSAQANMGIVYDYYKNVFNRNSFDNAGAQIKASVHVGRSYNNAYWNGTQLAFGDGDGSMFIALSGALDVTAHEFQHAVTSKTANLIYQNESGALNEAWSDIMGTAVEFYANDRPDWLMGEDISGPGLGAVALRSLADPSLMGDPDHYSKRYVGTQDNGGVHTNSGIANKIAYLVASGGTHYGVTVQGQGVNVMEKVFYRALTTYMTSSTNYAGAKSACVQSATDLYGAGSAQVKAVQDAFLACGI